jgi:hypothetical protein
MSDEEWRRWERLARESPGDRELVARAVGARRRVGLPVPGWLLERTVHPPRRFDRARPLLVWVIRPDGELEEVGTTPSRDPAGLELPAHRAWGVQPLPDPRLLPGLVDELEQHEIPGLALVRHYNEDEWSPEQQPLSFSDADLAPLERARGLRVLRLRGLTQLSDASLELVAGLPGLERLELRDCGAPTHAVTPGIGDAGLSLLSAGGGPPGLVALSLGGLGDLTDEGLRGLAGLPLLHELVLGSCPLLSDRAGSVLAQLPALERLRLWNVALSDASLQALRDSPALRALALVWTPGVTPAGLGALADLPALRELELGLQRQWSPGAFGPLGLLALESLAIKSTPVDASLLEALRGLTGLRRLALRGVHLEGPLLSGVLGAVVPGLRELDLDGNRGLAPSDLQRLDHLTALTSLGLRRCEVDDETLTHLAGRLPALESLDLTKCQQVTRAGVSALISARLRRLILRGCRGLDDSVVEALVELRELEELDLSLCRISEPALRRLRQALPDCRLVRYSA